MSVKISACTITKNEEKNIARSIESYKDYVDEIIVVDTGSTDNTVKIAESLGAKVIHFEWINDFAAARNCAVEAATGDWIMFLDADEWIRDNGGMKLQTVIERAIKHGFDAISLRMMNLEDDGSLFEITSALRLFANKPNIRYIRKIHEYLIDLDENKTLLGLRVEDLILNHSGYANSINKTKIKRNKELLEKNYMTEEVQAIDYFYLARENAIENPEYARQFLDMLTSDEEKMKGLKGLDIANNIYDLKIKLSKILDNKFSIEEKLQAAEEAIERYPDNPSYYFFKYLILVNSGKYNNQDLLYRAIELDKIYESKAGSNNNSFSRYKAEVLCELGKEALRINDTLKAMEYFVQAIQAGQWREDALKGLLYIVGSQELNEKIAFLNSLFDVNNQEQLKFIVQTLRLTQYNDIFLYYFVKYYKTFGEVDVSLFTSMLINEKFEDAANKYLAIFQNESDSRAEILVVSAILAGELKEFYDKNKMCFNATSRKILSSYFEETTVENITSDEEEIVSKVIVEILYVAPGSVLEKIKKIFKYNENILRTIIRAYYADRNYKQLISEINTFIENDLSDEFAGEVTAKLGECFCIIGDISNAQLYFEQAIKIGFLDKNVAISYENLIEKLHIDNETKRDFEEYKYLLERFLEAKNWIKYEKINDRNSDVVAKTVEEFEENISEHANITETFANNLFEYANKLLSMGNIYLAEEYYKILIRANFHIGKSYYNLGKIYNKLSAIELSYLCYDRAFRTSIDFAASILPEDHKNKYYLYNPNVKKADYICPICGGEGELVNCYQYIEDNNLKSDSNLIVKYRMCTECSHIFAENYIEKEICFNDLENKNQYIFNANDIKERLEQGTKLVVVDESDITQRVFSEDFDAVYLQGSFEKSINLDELLKQLDKYEGRTLITVINNVNNFLNQDTDMPLWAKVGMMNIYSKKSITKLLEDNGYNNIKIYDSKFIDGKMTVVACK